MHRFEILLVFAAAASALLPPQRTRRRRTIVRNDNFDDGAARGAWRTLKATLPPLVTGAWGDGDGDDDPLGALSNIALVRLPTLALAAYYAQYQITDGSPLVVDFGVSDIPTIVPPGVVWTVLGLLLLPIL